MTFQNRKPTRLKNYNYSQNGYYFITICTHNKKCIFSNIVGSIHESTEIKLNSNGIIVDKYINQLNTRFSLNIYKYVIMPNHIHLIGIIDERSIRESTLQKRSIISNAMGYLKMNSSRDIHKNGYALDVWQRSFHDHIIRGENDYLKIWNYIDTNPQKWKEDCFYIENRIYKKWTHHRAFPLNDMSVLFFVVIYI